jgi:hypothetical protein
VEFYQPKFEKGSWWITHRENSICSPLMRNDCLLTLATDGNIATPRPLEPRVVYDVRQNPNDPDDGEAVVNTYPASWLEAGQTGFVNDFIVEPIVFDGKSTEADQHSTGQAWIPGAGFFEPPTLVDCRKVAIWFDNKSSPTARVKTADQSRPTYFRLSAPEGDDTAEGCAAWFEAQANGLNFLKLRFEEDGQFHYDSDERDIQTEAFPTDSVSPQLMSRIRTQAVPTSRLATSNGSGPKLAAKNTTLINGRPNVRGFRN